MAHYVPDAIMNSPGYYDRRDNLHKLVELMQHEYFLLFWSTSSSGGRAAPNLGARLVDIPGVGRMLMYVGTLPTHLREHPSELEFFKLLGHQIHAVEERSASRQWRKMVAVVDSEETTPPYRYVIDTLEKGKFLYNAWLEKELRESFVEQEIRSIASRVTKEAVRLSKIADDSETGTTEHDAAIRAYRKEVAKITPLTTQAGLLAWYSDPNLLVCVVPTDGQTLSIERSPTKHVRRQVWSFTVVSNGGGRLKLRNVMKDRVALDDDHVRMTPTGTAADVSGVDTTQVSIRFNAEAPAGTYAAIIDLLEDGNPDPVAALEIGGLDVVTTVTAKAGEDVAVASGGTVQVGDDDEIANTDGSATVIAWTRVSGTGGTLDDATLARPTFTAPTVTEETEIVWRKTVTHGDASHSDDVTVTVEVAGE